MEQAGTKRKRARHAASSGSVLVVVLAIAGILAITGTGLLSLAVNTYGRALYTSREIAARSAAEAGVAKALFAMKSYDGVHLPSATNESVPECSGSFRYTVSLGTPDGYVVDATGTAGNATKTIHARLVGQSSLFCGLTLNETAVIKTNAQVVPASGSSNPRLVTNSTAANAISLDISIVFTGDVVVGPGGNPASVITNEQMVSGSVSAASQATTLPVVTAPTGLPVRGDITSATTLSQDGQCSKIDMHGSTLTVSGDRILYVTGNTSVKIDHAASIVITAGSSLKLYVAGSVTMNKVTVTSADGDPRRLLLLGTSTCTSVSIENNTDFYGAVYAPRAAVSLISGAEVFGAIAGKRISSIENLSKLHYDDRLQNVQIPGSGSTSYCVSYWQDN